jgi:membrane protease YdiL (CAAX protease family)
MKLNGYQRFRNRWGWYAVAISYVCFGSAYWFASGGIVGALFGILFAGYGIAFAAFGLRYDRSRRTR